MSTSQLACYLEKQLFFYICYSWTILQYSPCGTLSLLLKMGEDDKALLTLMGSVSKNTMQYVKSLETLKMMMLLQL